MTLRLYDSHNHLQDERFGPDTGTLMAAVRQQGVVRMVVNGSCEADWPRVSELARQYPEVLPSFGYHPWYVGERTADWQHALARHLDAIPSGVGEIGLDRWIEGYDFPAQEGVFMWQLRLAAERNLPVSIHCLKAWGRLLELLESGPRPSCGFVLHSYGGPPEMIPAFARLGGYFSLPGYFAHERKARQRDTFRHVPPERLLIETDAPDQLLPDNRNRFPLVDSRTGKPINHPANLGAVYEFAARWLSEAPETLAARVEQNFLRLFGGALGPSARP
jgi:TatD DNase family protein